MAGAVEIGVEGAGVGVGGDDYADVPVEETFVVVVAQLDEFVADAEFAGGGAQAATVGVERGLELEVEVADPGGAFVHGGENLHVTAGLQPRIVGGDKLGAEGEGFLQAVFGVAGDDEGEVGPGLELFQRVDRDGEGRVALVDGVGGGDDLALALLAMHDA